MLQRYLNFLAGISCNWMGKAGVVLTTSSFVTFIFLEIPRMLGLLTNAYIGLITYMALPALFIAGLLLIPFSWRKHRKQTGRTTQELLLSQFNDDDVSPGLFGARLIWVVVLLSLVNVVFLMAVSVRTLHFMDEANFCGTACHAVMNPEWVTYQQSPHAHVKCIQCHVGEGIGASIDAKLNGAWQVISASLELYERPIPTPVHELRPARETCEKCHWPEKFYGKRLKTMARHRLDEGSTPRYTTLSLKIDAGTRAGASGIHWHVAPQNEVRYASIEDERDQMIWVEARQTDGTVKRYQNRRLQGTAPGPKDVRTLDCIDCHNRATHIYEDPQRALDERLQKGRIDRTLPFIKREGLSAITRNYASRDAALAGIETHMRAFYRDNHPRILASRSEQIDRAVEVLQAIYDRNIHHGMRIVWGSYPSHLNHDGDGGCFRCHSPDMVDESGSTISRDCTLCHSILAYEADSPFKHLGPIDEKHPESRLHEYLRSEFLDSYH